MGVASDNVLNVADELFRELSESSDTSIPAISFYLRTNIGELNNLLFTSISVDTTSPFNFNPALTETQKSIYKRLYKIHYYEKLIHANLGASAFDNVLEVTSDGGTVRMANKNTVALTYSQLRRQLVEELNNLVKKHNYSDFQPLQVTGTDDIEEGETTDTAYTKLDGTVISR